MKQKIEAKVVAATKGVQGLKIITFELTFPRIILPEVLTHRMFSRNTSSSRAIPLSKMIEIIATNPFIPVAWQKSHKGMQGNEYFTEEEVEHENLVENWLNSRDQAIASAETLHVSKVTKQLCNRLLEPFMWVKMLVTTTMPGLNNFFDLRCPKYPNKKGEKKFSYSREEYISLNGISYNTDKDWLNFSQSQAEIHIQLLAEKMYELYRNAVFKEDDWHIPYREEIEKYFESIKHVPDSIQDYIILSVAKAARVSYTTIEDSEEMTLDKAKRIYNHCKENKHSSVFEHCAISRQKEKGVVLDYYNLHGFMSERYLIDKMIENAVK